MVIVLLGITGYLYASENEPCPDDMARIGGFCIDKFEAPNRKGENPLIMYSMIESEAWCEKRGKRLCFSDEWTTACVGPKRMLWSYGQQHQKNICNDSKTYKKYSRYYHAVWRKSFSNPYTESLTELMSRAKQYSEEAAAAANHFENLYQAEPSGSMDKCVSDYGVYDLLGNVEEWTKKRIGGRKNFSGRLKGRFWSEPRNCVQSVSNHGDYFRFYETGFRCCKTL